MTQEVDGELPPELADLERVACCYDQLVAARSEHLNWLKRFGQLPTSNTLSGLEVSVNNHLHTIHHSFLTILSTDQPVRVQATMIVGVIERDTCSRQEGYCAILGTPQEEVITDRGREEFIQGVEAAIGEDAESARLLIDSLMVTIATNITGNLGGVLEELSNTPRARLVRVAGTVGQATLILASAATAIAGGVCLYERLRGRSR